MKLSEAIRLGAMMKPKGDGHFEQAGRTCALGAAMDAVGLLDAASDIALNIRDVYGKHFPVLRSLVRHPDSRMGVVQWRLDAVIVDLNDDCGWTREQIADWVEQIECQHEAAKPKTAEVSA